MKMKFKFLIIILSLFLISGCKAEYNFTINDESISENLFIYDSYDNLNNGNNDQKIEELALEFEDFERGYDFYNSSRKLEKENRNRIGYRYNMDLDLNEYDALSIVRKCYEKVEINKGEKITINTSDEFLCFDYYKDLDDVTIKMSTDFKEVETNSNLNSDGEYIWNITKETAQNSPIKISIDTTSKEQNSNSINFLKITIFGIVIITLLIIIFVILKINKKIKKNHEV